ncbi:DUF3833 domain-containing protein [Corallincola platygyrae]|uniref:DUF3833 domain-containing protein n=1 Tax=Corallincola platygyrae TaxID=1193278 RepID=A0ABW4XP53_9GAMM
MQHTPMIFLTLVVILFYLTACSADIDDYRAEEPPLVLEEYFDGDLIAYGILQDYSGKLTRRFCVELNGQWKQEEGNLVGILDEDFFFDDGEKQKRIWRLVRHQNGESVHYTGTAGDVIGEASGRTVGNAFHWKYVLRVPVRDEDGSVTEYDLNVDDWMYLFDEEKLFNRSELIKFGITVGEVTLYFEKGDRLTCDANA